MYPKGAMNRRRWLRLAYSRPAGPIVLILLFVICSMPFLALGSLLNTTYAPITVLPIYPHAQALTLPTATTVGLLSAPTPAVRLPSTTPDYSFTTTDKPDAVTLFYKNAFQRIYGQQSVWVESQGTGLTIVHADRISLYNVMALEQASVAISSTPDGLTHVVVKLDAEPLPRP